MIKKKLERSTLILAILIVFTGTLNAEESVWNQFRGISGQGYAETDAKPPVEFDAKTDLTWNTKLPGRGWSSPVIMGDEIWMTTAIKKGTSFRAISVDAKTGKRLRNIELFTIDEPVEIHNDNSYASPTPIIDSNNVYAHFGRFGTAAIDRKSGRVVWKNDELKIEHQGGPGSSPVEFEDFIIITMDGADEQYVAALKKSDGKIVWKRERSAPYRENPITHRAFSTPLMIPGEKQPLLVSIGADQVHGYNPADGSELWHARFTGFSNVPAPVSNGTHIFMSTGFFSPELLAIRLGGSGDVTSSHVDWKHTAQVTVIPSPIIVEDEIYMISEKGILNCLSTKDGKKLWRERVSGKFSASPIFAGGHIYLCSENGRVTVIKPNPKKYEMVSSNLLPSRIKASPIAIGSTLYIRTEDGIVRIDSK